MKTNFKKSKKLAEKKSEKNDSSNKNPKKKITQKEFEEFILKSKVAGSFMIFRSKNKDDELGIDEL